MDNGDGKAPVKVRDLLLRPHQAWPVIADTDLSTRTLLWRYVLPLALIAPVAKAIGAAIFGVPVAEVFFHPSIFAIGAMALVVYIINLVVVLALSGVIHGFAGVFDGDGRYSQALKLAVFSSVPGWIGGVIFAAPGLWILAAIANLYGFYLLAVGIAPVMGINKERSVIYGGLLLVLFALLWAVASFATVVSGRAGLIPKPGEVAPDGRVVVPGVGSLDLRQAKDALRQLHGDRSGDGKPVPVTPPDELETLFPLDLQSGHHRTEMTGSNLSVGGFSGSRAEAVYVRENSRIEVALLDAGAAKALIDAMTLKSSRTTETGYEKSGLVDGRTMVEKYDRVANIGEYSVVVAGRYIVQVKGNADIATLKAAAQAVDFERLEAIAKG